MMATVEYPALFEEVIEFLASTPTPQQIIAFQPSNAIQQRVRALLEKQRGEGLTEREQSELDQLGVLNHLMSMLKIRARQKLNAA